MESKTTHPQLHSELVVLENFQTIDLKEVIFNKEIEYLNLERKVRSLTLKKAEKIHLINESTIILENINGMVRSKQEVGEAYKIVLERKVNLNKIKVYNLHFSFINQEFESPPTAMMCKLKDHDDILILIFPDDTNQRIQMEENFYLETIDKLVQRYKLNQKDEAVLKNRLITNFDLIRGQVSERCAQSLMHEYGHVLHMQVFTSLNLDSYDKQYKWFKDSGYLDIIIKRIPEFLNYRQERQLYLLKESLVEDYRIWRNQESQRGKFILPNSSCFLVDLFDPTMLKRGIDIMKNMLRSAMDDDSLIRKTGTEENEANRINLGKEILESTLATNWSPPKVVADEDITIHEEDNDTPKKNLNVIRGARSMTSSPGSKQVIPTTIEENPYFYPKIVARAKNITVSPKHEWLKRNLKSGKIVSPVNYRNIVKSLRNEVPKGPAAIIRHSENIIEAEIQLRKPIKRKK